MRNKQTLHSILNEIFFFSMSFFKVNFSRWLLLFENYCKPPKMQSQQSWFILKVFSSKFLPLPHEINFLEDKLVDMNGYSERCKVRTGLMKTFHSFKMFLCISFACVPFLAVVWDMCILYAMNPFAKEVHVGKGLAQLSFNHVIYPRRNKEN